MTADLQAETTAVLQRLVRFNTVNPPGNERPAIEYLATYVEAAGFETQIVAADDDRPNLVATLEGERGGTHAVLPRARRHGAGGRRPSGRTTHGRATSPTGSSGAAARST